MTAGAPGDLPGSRQPVHPHHARLQRGLGDLGRGADRRRRHASWRATSGPSRSIWSSPGCTSPCVSRFQAAFAAIHRALFARWRAVRAGLIREFTVNELLVPDSRRALDRAALGHRLRRRRRRRLHPRARARARREDRWRLGRRLHPDLPGHAAADAALPRLFRRQPPAASRSDAWTAAALGLTLYCQRLPGRDLARLHPGRSPRAVGGRATRSRSATRAAPLRSSCRRPLRIALPPTVGFLVQLIKGTSLASIIGFTELTRAAADRQQRDLPAAARLRHRGRPLLPPLLAAFPAEQPPRAPPRAGWQPHRRVSVLAAGPPAKTQRRDLRVQWQVARARALCLLPCARSWHRLGFSAVSPAACFLLWNASRSQERRRP